MGRRGPRPQPTALKMLRGNPSHRPINGEEPKPKSGIPRCPSWLDNYAKACWREIVPQLHDMQVLSLIDRQALANYCQVWSRWRKAEEFLQKHGDALPIKDESGNLKYLAQFPQVAIARNLLTILNRYQAEFGLTPSARTRISVPHQKVRRSGIERFISGARNC